MKAPRLGSGRLCGGALAACGAAVLLEVRGERGGALVGSQPTRGSEAAPVAKILGAMPLLHLTSKRSQRVSLCFAGENTLVGKGFRDPLAWSQP